MSKLQALARSLAGIVLSSVVLILLALVYFIVTAWIVDFGVDAVTGTPPSADFVALSAAILSIGGLAGSTISMGSTTPGATSEDPYGDQEVV